MAKQQTFGDKSKKKKGEEKIFVKIVKGVPSKTGSLRFLESFVSVKDLSELDKMDFTK